MSRELIRNVIASIGLAGVCLIGWAPTSTAAAAFLVLWLPGASIVRAIPSLDHISGRRTVIVATSISLVVIPLSWFWRLSNAPTDVTLFVCGLNVALAILAHTIRLAYPARQGDLPPKPTSPNRAIRWVLVGICTWIAICVMGAFWIPTAFDRATSNGTHDYVKHHAIVFSLNEHPLPLRNAFNDLNPETPYYYYEYHYTLAASIRAMAELKPSIAITFGLVSAVLAVVVIRLTFWISLTLTKSPGGALLSAACVSVLGGWDAIPVAIRALGGSTIPIILDTWCPVAWRIHNFVTQYYWCPQHVAAVCTLMLTAYWLLQSPKGRWWLILGPCLGASVFGESVYVAIPVFVSTAIFCVHWWWRSDAGRGRFLGAVLLIAAVGAAMMVVQALGYHEMNNRFDGGLTFAWERFRYAFSGRILPPGPLANYLDAWWLAIVDFGIPGLGMLLINRTAWQRAWSLAGVRLLLISGAVGFIAMFTLRSSINPIDYGFRVSVMPTMVVAAILAGGLMRTDWIRPSLRKARMPLLILGALFAIPVGLHEAPLEAARTLITKSPDQNDAAAYLYLRNETPTDAVVQAAPVDARVTLLQIISRQMGASFAGSWHVRVFWPPAGESLTLASELAESAYKTTDAKTAYELLKQMHVTHVLAGTVETDEYGPMPQFEDATYFERVYSDEYARVYRLKRPNE